MTENVHIACCGTEVKLGEWVMSEMLYGGLKDVRVVADPEVSCAVHRQVRALLFLGDRAGDQLSSEASFCKC